MKATTVLALILPCLFLPAHADPVDAGQVTTFQPGAPAIAAAVNQNFQALIDAINDNAARIAELEASARISNRTLLEHVSGSVYQFYTSELATGTAATLTATTTNRALFIWTYGGHGTFTFNANGTFSVVSNIRDREIQLETSGTVDGGNEDFSKVKLRKTRDLTESNTQVDTWSLSGQNLTLNIDGETIVLKVSPDGENFMLIEILDDVVDAPYGGTNNLGMLVVATILGNRINPVNLNIESFDGTELAHQSNYTGPAGSATLRLVNLGDSDLTGLALTGTGGLTITSGLSTTSLGPGAHQLITVAFPSGSSKLEVTSIDADTPVYEINF